MKKIEILFLITGLFYGCETTNQESVNDNSENIATFDRNVASIRAFIQGFADEDLEAQMALFSDTALWSPPQ